MSRVVINSNLPPCTVSKLWPIIGQIFASDRGVSHSIALASVDPLPIFGKTLLMQKLE